MAVRREAPRWQPSLERGSESVWVQLEWGEEAVLESLQSRVVEVMDAAVAVHLHP